MVFHYTPEHNKRAGVAVVDDDDCPDRGNDHHHKEKQKREEGVSYRFERCDWLISVSSSSMLVWVSSPHHNRPIEDSIHQSVVLNRQD